MCCNVNNNQIHYENQKCKEMLQQLQTPSKILARMQISEPTLDPMIDHSLVLFGKLMISGPLLDLKISSCSHIYVINVIFGHWDYCLSCKGNVVLLQGEILCIWVILITQTCFTLTSCTLVTKIIASSRVCLLCSRWSMLYH